MLQTFLLLTIIQQFFSYTKLFIDQRNAMQSQTFVFNKVNYLNGQECIIYGLWSKYNSFSLFGLQQTDSSVICYNLINALEMNTRKSNFLYYDCLDLEQKTIKKIMQFVDEKEVQHNYILDLDIYQYENIWYYLGISLWINKNQFEFVITQNQNIQLYSKLDDSFPFYDQNLFITFGGELYLNNYQRVTTLNQNLQFLFLPGKLYYYPVQILQDFLDQQMHEFAILDFDSLEICSLQDQRYNKTKFIDQTLKFMNSDAKITINEICDYFGIDGWIKGIKIQQTDQEFLYKFIKISANSENEQIINDNLCPFQLLYRIQNEKLYLEILTYSYTYPSFFLDLSSNPFLIKKEFELQLQRLYQWHFLSVRLQEKKLTIQITFYERESQYQLSFNTQVQQFYNVRFRMSIGNLFQSKNNYIEMKIFALTLISVWTIDQQNQCHSSCKTCEGPTQNDCLSCDQTLFRFYIPETQSCVCPENLLDHADGTCKNYENLQFSLVVYEKSKLQCKYGYFKYDESTCVKCPSNPDSNTIFCLNCLQNPLTWKSNPLCETIILYNKSDTLLFKTELDYDEINYKFYQYLYDEENIKFCKDCDKQSLIDLEQIYIDFSQMIKIKEQQNTCESQCLSCQWTLGNFICTQCSAGYQLVDGRCIFEQYTSTQCYFPYYRNSQKFCKLCDLENCLYCFEYLKNDLSKNTLYKGFEIFIADEFDSLQYGCALCQEGYQFNFLIGKCQFQEPQIQNCKRSFINLEGVEVCTLANSQSFEIAPEIINCQWKIKNCYSCIRTPYQVIKCIVCEDGYSTDILTGECILCTIKFAIKCIQGDMLLQDGWAQLLQSFMMQFLNKNYFYPNPDYIVFINHKINLQNFCEDGYKPSLYYNNCEKYCNSDCLKCELSSINPYGFVCVDCPLNYYNQPSRSTDQRNCIVCPKLCLICEPRTSEEIIKLNPYFIITEENVQFTHKCIQQIQRNDVYMDSEVQIAKLILKNLDDILNFDVSLIQQFLIEIDVAKNFFFYQDFIDYQYCNYIGVDIFQITFNFESKINKIKSLSFSYEYEDIIDNTLKQQIFSLKLIIFNLIGLKQESNNYYYHLRTNNFDFIKITNIDFFLVNPNYFIFYNDQPIQLTIKNCTFQNKVTLSFVVFNVNITYSKSIQFHNLTFQNLYLLDSIIFNISGEYLSSEIIIFDILLQNCEFINSSLISVFHNYQDIQIQNLLIVNSTFNNSNLIDFNTKNSLSKRGYFKNIQFFNNKFYNCDFIKIFNFQQFIMSNVLISGNFYYNSMFFVINSNFKIDKVKIVSNSFENSSFLVSSDTFSLNKIVYIFNNLQLKDNKFSKSFLFFISPQYKQDIFQLSVIFKDIEIQNNQIETSLINQFFLFQIHCNDLQLYNITIKEQISIYIIFIYDTYSTQIQKLDFTNPLDNIRIPIKQDCSNNFKLQQVIKVFGFNTIELEDFYINNLNVQDSPILEFHSNILFNANLIEKISMKNVIFQNNILLNFNIGKRMSLIYIYSEKIQTLIFDQINFFSNLFHQIADDLSENKAGLIYISSQMSNITITNIVSKYNGITNSSCSFLYFITNSLFISNYQIDGLNIFNEQQLQRYINNTEIFKQYKNEEIQLIIQKLVSIQTKGAACYATVTQLEIKDSLFLNILSYTSPLFELKTQGKGQITLQNLIIRNIDVIYDSNQELQGSINVYSFNSLLNLNFINLIFDKVLNKLSPSILSLTPSQRKNQIVFKNILILNSLTLYNQIIKAEFLETVKESNFVSIQNVSIIQTDLAWFEYFKKIGQIYSEDLQKIMSDNAMINVVSCTLTIENLFVQGILQSPIIKVQNAVNLKIINCKFYSIKTFYQFNIIQISQNKYYSMEVNIYHNEFRYLQLYQPDSEYQIQQLLLNVIKHEQNCQFQNYNLIFYFNVFSFANIFKLFSSLQNSGSLINLQSISDQNNVRVKFLKMEENICNFCYEGLISITIQKIKKLKIKELQCIKNQVIKFGCLYIYSNKDYENQFSLSDSVFALNLGQSGGVITFTNLKGLIQRTLIFNNSAIDVAGGMEITVLDNKFLFQNTFIFQNQAQQCGGIKFNSYSNIQNENFILSLSLFNKADQLANNVVEAPTQLALKINDQVMKHLLEINDNVTLSILKMPVQNIIKQNNFYFSKYLMLPSNQKIVDYKIFDLQTLQYIPYITEFSLIFLNSQREQLGNFEDQNCTVFLNIIQLNNVLINQNKLFLVNFDKLQNKIDLGNLYFPFHPNEQSQYIQEIEIICNISQNKALSYKFKTKSFYCQLGEFYTNSGCQICDSKFGFYSVSYNATKCSIFDKTKFSEITSNSISLLPGFWRPDYLSDYTEFCYQKQRNCLGGWSVGDSSCLQGNLGGLCYECDFYNERGDGYYFKNLDNDECSLCNDSNNYVMYFIIVSLIAMISIFLTLRSIEKTNILFNNLKVGQKFGKIIFKLNQDHESFLIKMFVNYLWIFSLIYAYNINFSINLNIIDQASNASFSMANNLDCFLADIQEINLVYIRLIVTIFFIFIQLILVYIIIIVISKVYKSKLDLSNLSNTSLYLYISNNAALTKQFCSLIAKKSISDIDFVQGNMALKFNSITHQNWILAFILPGLSINGCVIPLLLITILLKKRNQLDQIQIRKYFCYLFNEYNETNYYWEQIKIWQKTILIIIMVYFEARVFLKTTLFGLTLIIYQYLANYYKPYIILSLNKLDYQAGLLCCIAIFLAAARNESNLLSSFEISYILQITIAFLCLLLIYLYTNILLRAYYKKYKLTALLLFLTITKKLSFLQRLTESLQTTILTEQNRRDRLYMNFGKLKKNLVKIYRLNSQFRQDQTLKTDQTLDFITNKSIKLQN